MSDEPESQHSHDPAPISQDGQPDGEPTSAAPDGPGRDIEATASEPIAATSTASQASTGTATNEHSEATVLPATWCPNCQREVQPVGRGRCSGCGRVLANNRMRTKLLPLNVARRNELQRAYEADFQPITTHTRSMCRRLAAVGEMLERVKLGTPEHQRLEQISRDLATELEASRHAVHDREADPLSGVDAMPQPALELARDLLQRLADGETLTDFERGQLAVLNAAMKGTVVMPPDPPRTPAPPTTPAFDSSPVVTTDPPPESEPASAPDSRCQYCGALASRCTTVRNDPRWLAQHQSRVDVQAFLDEQAAIRRRLGWDAVTVKADPFTSASNRRDDDPTAERLEALRRQRDGGDPWIR